MERADQIVNLDRLQKIILYSQLQGLHNRIEIIECRDYDKNHFRIAALQFPDGFDSVQAGHTDVHANDIRLQSPGFFYRLASGLRLRDFYFFQEMLFDDGCNRFPGNRFIVRNQNFEHALLSRQLSFFPVFGNKNVILVPTPGALSIRMIS